MAEAQRRSTYVIPEVPERFNVVEELLETHVRGGRRDRPAVWFPNPDTGAPGSISYGELSEKVNRTGNVLRTMASKGDRIGILLPDSPHIHYLFLGAMKIGTVPVPMSTFASGEIVLRMLRKGGIRVLVTNLELLQRLESAGAEASTVVDHIVLTAHHARYPSLEELVDSASPSLQLADTSKDDIAFWFYTSGSTGEPKGVVHTHYHIHHAAYSNYGDWVKVTEDDRIFSAAKLFFSAGLGPGLYAPLTFGASSVLFPGKTSAEACYEIIRSFRPTLFFAVPTIYAKMLQVPNPERYDLTSLRLCLTGGEPLPPVVYNEWLSRAGVKIIEGVGAAEMTHHFFFNPLHAVRPGSGGKLLPGFEAKIVDGEGGREVGANEIGELLLRGGSSFLCYWNDEDKTKKTILDGGWVRLGDLFRVDEDGYYYFCGRQDFAFKVGGLWVSPIKLESILIKSPGVLECCIVPHSRGDGITVPVAFVVLKRGIAPTPELEAQLRGEFAGKVSRFEVPQVFRFLDALPKTSVDKTDRKALVQMLASA